MQLTYICYCNLCYTDELNTKFIAAPQVSSKTGKKWRNKGITELYWLFVAAVGNVDAISFINGIGLWSKEQVFP